MVKIVGIWTKENIEILRSMWGAHLTKDIAAKIPGATKNAVIGKAHRLGLHRLNDEHSKFCTQLALKKKFPRKKKKTIRKPSVNGISIADEQPRIDKCDKHLSMESLRPHHCRWPMWADNGAVREKLYCGKRKGAGSYCAEHHALAYRPVPPRRKDVEAKARLEEVRDDK